MHRFSDLPNDYFYTGRVARRDIDAAGFAVTETKALDGKVSLFAIDNRVLGVEVRGVSTISTDDFGAMPEGALIPEPLDLTILAHLTEHGKPLPATPVETPKVADTPKSEPAPDADEVL